MRQKMSGSCSKNIQILVLAVMAAAGMTTSARANVITYEYGGQITFAAQKSDPLPADISVGASFTGSFSFDTTTPNADLGTVNGDYLNGLTAFQVTVGATTITMADVLSKYNTRYSDSNNVRLINDAAGVNISDVFNPAVYSDQVVGPNTVNEIALSLSLSENTIGVNPTALTTTTLGGDILDLSKFTATHQISFADVDMAHNTFHQFIGDITSLRLVSDVSTVPEPSSIALLIVGCLGSVAHCAVRRRRMAE